MAKQKVNHFKLTLNPIADTKSIALSWQKPNEESNYIYKIYGRNTNKDAKFKELRQYKIRVLEVYPKEAQLKYWIQEYGLGQIECFSMPIEAFNKIPEEAWNYDVIVFGFADMNRGKDLNEKSAKVVEEYIKAGKGVLFGHDTVTTSKTYFRKFAGDLKLKLEEQSDRQLSWCSRICVTKKGALTSSPYELGKINTKYGIPTSHSNFQYPSGDVWMIFESDQSPYLTTWKNCALIQTGHSDGKPTNEEQKLLINTLMYLVKNIRTVTYLNEESSGESEKQKFEIENLKIDIETKKIQFDIKHKENRSQYEYYIQAIDLDKGSKLSSSIESIQLENELKGYLITIDNQPYTIPNLEDIYKNSHYEGTLNKLEDRYIHICAIYANGSTSEALHYLVPTTYC